MLSWVPEVLVVLVVLAAVGNVQYDLGHRWFGLPATDPDSHPAAVLPPEGLDLPAGTPAPAVAAALTPGSADPARVRSALTHLLADKRLGKHVDMLVTDLSTGTVLFQRGSGSVTPASTTKLLTSLAALQSLGPMTRFSTRVVAVGDRLTLVGGGDPFLASTPAAAKGRYPARADAQTLARRTAAALTAQGIRQVRLSYDATLFTGPGMNPNWPAAYGPDSVVPPIRALWVDEGKVDHRFVTDPAAVAGHSFATSLAKAGIKVVGPVRAGKAPADAVQVAEMKSAPVGEIVQHTLTVSDNNAAEVLARQVALKVGTSPSFSGGTTAVFRVLDELGVDLAGSRIYDGSGLSRRNHLTPTTLLDVLRTAASPEHPTLREVITGLPVAGFTGSLQERFDDGPTAARGRVLAKTGTLTGVHGLAGVATDLDGDLLGFVIIADRVSVPNTLPARHQIDLMAAALGACHCGRPKDSPVS
ncbi:D-alanyl-D-alanine carboxypeptidase/D-alanyl-D-alanine endopeptidase [Nocardioides marmorisolisilvae]|uniref:D-alanyl-D-alanine carboxypeptidase/D-alanyl-D-alanine endopeptidase n=1 Tax=Nocardioides marmorisolisilvae TaxID=1542737 RepID=UPI00160FEA40|nr:D-alanyl-D-alanine carboxypeptidase/D-alanyl-D-alanine-endopeptidase [Nocardioides marmorisolisilvae]